MRQSVQGMAVALAAASVARGRRLSAILKSRREMPELRQVMFVFEEDGVIHTGFAPYDLWSQHRPAAGVAERAFDRDSDALLAVAAGKARAGHVTSQGHVRLSADDYAPATAGWPSPRD